MLKKMWNFLMHLGRQILTVLLHPFGVKIDDTKWCVAEQFIKFAMVGCSNALITLLVYYLVTAILGQSSYLVAQTLGYIAGIFNSYFWNSKFVFSSGDNSGKTAFFKMAGSYVITYFVQIGLLYLFVSVIRVSAQLAPIFAILITTPINFVLNKIWAFRDK